MNMPDRGAAYWLWEEEERAQRSIDRLTENIADLERQIVAARSERDDRRLVVYEMRAARQLIETAGLKVEQRGTEVHVSVERSFAEPAEKIA